MGDNNLCFTFWGSPPAHRLSGDWGTTPHPSALCGCSRPSSAQPQPGCLAGQSAHAAPSPWALRSDDILWLRNGKIRGRQGGMKKKERESPLHYTENPKRMPTNCLILHLSKHSLISLTSRLPNALDRVCFPLATYKSQRHKRTSGKEGRNWTTP